MALSQVNETYPHSLLISIPFPTNRLAKAALRTLSVDEELSTLVKRDFALVSSPSAISGSDQAEPALASSTGEGDSQLSEKTSDLTLSEEAILQVRYRATTPRMLRVAVNGFFESLSVIVQVMEELDSDVLHEKGIENLEGVQGVEQGMTGSAIGVGS